MLVADAEVSEKMHALTHALSQFAPIAATALAALVVALTIRRLLAKGHDTAAVCVFFAVIIGLIVVAVATGPHNGDWDPTILLW